MANQGIVAEGGELKGAGKMQRTLQLNESLVLMVRIKRRML